MEQVAPPPGVPAVSEIVRENEVAPALPGTFAYPEDHLTTALGVPRRTLREARTAGTRGVDWELTGKRIWWSQEATDRFVAQLSPASVPLDPPETPVVPSNGHVELAAPQVLRVVQWNFPNRRVIHCVPESEVNTAQEGTNGLRQDGRPQDQDRVAVRVRDSRLFRTGMRVLARPVLGSAWQFEGNPDNPAAGPRGPRRPGRW